jgi:hypothetical protein
VEAEPRVAADMPGRLVVRSESSVASGDAEEEPSARFNEFSPLAKRSLVVVDVLEDLKCADQIE